jgi:hypothetical protein
VVGVPWVAERQSHDLTSHGHRSESSIVETNVPDGVATRVEVPSMTADGLGVTLVDDRPRTNGAVAPA